MLGRAITLIESSLDDDQKLASQLLEAILDKTGHAIRIGITGVPGVGKSTFIEAFGNHIILEGRKLAVLTIDPSSQLTKGSILGDKTRMEELSKNPMAFIRPSSSGTMLGGVATKTREAMLLCEAAGYEVIIIETVGVGQSEVAVKNMVDFFLLLMLAGAGDELQGIKKGIMEMADGLVITKADGDNIKQATAAQSEYQHAMHLHAASTSGWSPKVLTSSARTTTGIDTVWKMILAYQEQTLSTGYFNTNRQLQNISWLHEYTAHLLKNDFNNFAQFSEVASGIENNVALLKLSPQAGARDLLLAYHNAIQQTKS
jgi:LAO/AO transport system kinase